MENGTQTQRTGQARGNLMRLEQQLGRAKGNLKGATRNGGIVVGLLIGGWVFIRALAKMGQERRSIDKITDRATDASANLAELKAQPAAAD